VRVAAQQLHRGLGDDLIHGADEVLLGLPGVGEVWFHHVKLLRAVESAGTSAFHAEAEAGTCGNVRARLAAEEVLRQVGRQVPGVFQGSLDDAAHVLGREGFRADDLVTGGIVGHRAVGADAQRADRQLLEHRQHPAGGSAGGQGEDRAAGGEPGTASRNRGETRSLLLSRVPSMSLTINRGWFINSSGPAGPAVRACACAPPDLPGPWQWLPPGWGRCRRTGPVPRTPPSAWGRSGAHTPAGPHPTGPSSLRGGAPWSRWNPR